ncbi:hypothetical protein BDV19DRAFT_387553 [Aspergillus venezuelensis]
MASPKLSASDLREVVFQANDPKRLVIRLKTTQLDSTDYRSYSADFISQIFPSWQTDPRIRFLAIGIWTYRTFLVLDINNTQYSFETAHSDRTILPVHVIRQYRRNSNWAMIRWAPEDILLAANLANMHNRHGWGAELPFLEDRTDISTMVFANPREFRPSVLENEFHEGG